MADQTIKPVHFSFQNEGSNSTHTSLSSPYQLSPKAYQTFTNEGSSSTHTSLRGSGFQYLITLGNTATGNATENMGLFSSYTRTVTRSFTEGLGATENYASRPAKFAETVGLTSSYTRQVIRVFAENIGGIDNQAPQKSFNEGVGLTSSYTRQVIRTFSENIGATDSGIAFTPFSTLSTVKIVGQSSFAVNSTTAIEVESVMNNLYTVEVQGVINTLVGVTASGGTNQGANTFNPNVSVGGVTLIGIVTGAANTPVYVDIPNSNIPNNNWGQMFNFSTGLDYLGGTWSVTSQNFVASKGSQIFPFGLLGTVTADGGGQKNIVSNSAKGYATRGIYGPAKFDKQLSLLLGLNNSNGGLLLNQLNANISLYTQVGGFSSNVSAVNSTGQTLSLPVQFTSTFSIRETVQFLAQKVGMNIIWASPDNVLNQAYTIQPTMTAVSAIQSLVSELGSVLRWSGGDTYYVCAPNFAIGEFIVPQAKLVTANGLFFESLENLEYGIGGVVTPIAFSPNQGVFTIPTNAYNFYNAVQVPNSSTAPQGSGNPAYVNVASIRKLLTVDDPPVIVDLPFEYDQVFARIFITDPNNASPNASFNQLATYNNNIVTTNPDLYFSFAESVNFADTFITQVLRGNVYTPIITIDSRFFPANNPSVANGTFSYDIAVTLKNLNGAFAAAQTATPQKINIQYVKTYQGTINCLFYGVMPLPGMFASAQVDDILVQGIIESVSFTPPGYLTLQVAQYTQLNFITPYIQIGPRTS